MEANISKRLKSINKRLKKKKKNREREYSWLFSLMFLTQPMDAEMLSNRGWSGLPTVLIAFFI